MPNAFCFSKRMGHCLKIQQCRQNEVFWPMTNECFPKYSKGPCPEGQLITVNKGTWIVGIKIRTAPVLNLIYLISHNNHPVDIRTT